MIKIKPSIRFKIWMSAICIYCIMLGYRLAEIEVKFSYDLLLLCSLLIIIITLQIDTITDYINSLKSND